MGRVAFRVDPAGEPAANMEADQTLAQRVLAGVLPSTLRVYRWARPAVSVGRAQKPEHLPEDLLRRRLPLVRRPTGGGAVVHDPGEFTYALAASPEALPAGVALSRLPGLIHRNIRRKILELGWIPASLLQITPSEFKKPSALCFSSPVCGDLVYQGTKVAGSALRVWRGGLLVQGSIQGLPLEYNRLVEVFSRLAEEGPWGEAGEKCAEGEI